MVTTYEPGAERAARTYLREEIESADPVRRMVLVHNRLVGELRRAADELRRADAPADAPCPADVSARLARCREILRVLIALEDDDDVGRRMRDVFFTATEKILTAERDVDAGPIEQILPSLEIVRDRWVALVSEGS